MGDAKGSFGEVGITGCKIPRNHTPLASCITVALQHDSPTLQLPTEPALLPCGVCLKQICSAILFFCLSHGIRIEERRLLLQLTLRMPGSGSNAARCSGGISGLELSCLESHKPPLISAHSLSSQSLCLCQVTSWQAWHGV